MTDQPFEIERYAKFMLTAVVVTICADGLGVLLGTILNPIVSTILKSRTNKENFDINFLLMFSRSLFPCFPVSLFYLVSCTRRYHFIGIFFINRTLLFKILFFTEWYICWRCIDLLHVDILRFSYTPHTYVEFNALIIVLIANSLCTGRHGIGDIF